MPSLVGKEIGPTGYGTMGAQPLQHQWIYANYIYQA
jgi:hypothetical protein